MTKKIQMLHKTLGVGMWVTESEVDKYLAAGHKLAATSAKPAEEKREEVEPEIISEEPKKKPAKKRK